MLRFTLLFPVLLLGLFALYVLDPVDQNVVTPFTTGIAHFSTWLVGIFDHDVVAIGKIIRSTTNGFAVSIERGCNGLEAVIILFAAIFAFPAPLLHRVLGFVGGFFAIQALNIVRIISLFYLGEWETEKAAALFWADDWGRAGCGPVAGSTCPNVWFDWFHLYLWQALIIIDALVVWLVWLRWLPKTPRPAASA